MTVEIFTRSDAIRLIDQYQSAIYRYIYACVRTHVDAEDIFQDVSVIIFESISRLQSEKAFFAWSREIAFKQVLAFLRSRKREKLVNPHVVAALAEAAGRVEDSDIRQEALFECLEKLPSRSRDLITLRYSDSVQGVDEVAAQYELSVNAVYARLNRIKQILRDCVQRHLSREESE